MSISPVYRMLDADQLQRLASDVAIDNRVAAAVQQVDGSWVIQDHRTGWRHAASSDQVLKLKAAGAIIVPLRL